MNNFDTSANAKHFSEDEVLTALMGETVTVVYNMTYKLTYDSTKLRNPFNVKILKTDGEGILRLFAVVDCDEQNLLLLGLA
jgi:hypothetical protein